MSRIGYDIIEDKRVCAGVRGVAIGRAKNAEKLREKRSETHILVRDDLDVLHMSGRLEDLAQNFLGDARIQSANVEGALVGFGRGATDEATGRIR